MLDKNLEIFVQHNNLNKQKRLNMFIIEYMNSKHKLQQQRQNNKIIKIVERAQGYSLTNQNRRIINRQKRISITIKKLFYFNLKIKQRKNHNIILNNCQINQLKQFIDQNFVIQKQRSDSVDTIKKTQKFDHARSQSQISIVSTLESEISGSIQSPKNIQYSIQNPQEIFDSTDDPIQILQKPFSEWNSYQLSFNQNQLKSISGISGQEQSFITQKESSLHGSILEAMYSNRNKKPEIYLIVFFKLNQCSKIYDPIKNEDPTKYGYKLYRIDNEFNIFSSEVNKNMNSYQKFEMRLEVSQLILDNCSQNALKFRMIYEPSMRGIVQDSLALRHLNYQHLPFKLQGNSVIINGLCLNKQDLIKLQLLSKQ